MPTAARKPAATSSSANEPLRQIGAATGSGRDVEARERFRPCSSQSPPRARWCSARRHVENDNGVGGSGTTCAEVTVTVRLAAEGRVAVLTSRGWRQRHRIVVLAPTPPRCDVATAMRSLRRRAGRRQGGRYPANPHCCQGAWAWEKWARAPCCLRSVRAQVADTWVLRAPVPAENVSNFDDCLIKTNNVRLKPFGGGGAVWKPCCLWQQARYAARRRPAIR